MRTRIALVLVLSLLIMAIPAFAEAPIADIDAWAKEQADMLAPDQKQVNILTWTYYIPDEVVNDFVDLTGIEINYTASMDDNEGMRAKLAASPATYDLMVVSDYIIGEMGEAGLLSELDRDKIPNYVNVDPNYQGQFYDPDNKYTIPYTNTIPLICYNADEVPFEVTSYADLWRDDFKDSLALVAEPRVIIGMAQKKLGFSYNETDPEKMALVAEELETLKPNIMLFNSDTPHMAMINDGAKAGFMFGSQIIAAQSELPNVKSAYPSEGLGFGIDNIILPADLPHMDATYIFLNYLLDGKVSAYASDLIDYGNCNLAAGAFMTPEFLAMDSINVAPELVAGAEMIRPLDAEAQKIYDDIWVNFRK